MSLLKSIANALTFRNSRGGQGYVIPLNITTRAELSADHNRKGTDTITSVGTLSLLHKGVRR